MTNAYNSYFLILLLASYYFNFSLYIQFASTLNHVFCKCGCVSVHVQTKETAHTYSGLWAYQHLPYQLFKNYYVTHNMIFFCPSSFLSREIGGEISHDGDFLVFEGNHFRNGFMYKNFVMSAIVS